MKINIIANFMGKFWSILSNFLFIPLYIKYLGISGYSIISFSILLMGIMVLLDSGLSSTLSREMAKEISRRKKIAVLQTLESCYCVIASIVCLGLFFLAKIIAVYWLKLGEIPAQDVAYYIKIMSIGVASQLLLQFYIGGLLGLEKHFQANVYLVSWGIIRNGLVVLGIAFFPSLYLFFLWQTIITLFFMLIIRKSLYLGIDGYVLYDFYIDKKILKDIGKFTSGVFLIIIVSVVTTQLDKLIVSKVLDIENLGYYTLSFSLATCMTIIINPISMASLPRLTALYSAGEKEDAFNLYHQLNRFVIVIVASVSAVLIFYANKIVWVWTGDVSIAQKVAITLPWLVIGFGMLALQFMPYNIAIANGYTLYNNVLGISSLLFTVPGYWLGFRYYGVEGIAITFFISQMFSTLIYVYLINNKFLKPLSYYQVFIKEMILPFLLAFGIVFFSMKVNFFNESRLVSFLYLASLGAFVLIVTASVIIPLSEIKKILKKK